MSSTSFPALITSLPEADIPFAGIRGWILQSDDRQAVFMDIEAIGEVSPHSHGEQWGTVIDGEIELTIDGRRRRMTGGETYHIPAGVVHSARFLRRTLIIDVFADPDRFRAK